MVLGIEFSCFPAMAPPRNAVGPLFWPERRRLFSPIQSEPFILNPTAENQGYRFGQRFC
jgi:hypothetical protein